MKKKLLFIFSVLCLFSTVHAEETMNFATVLSYPVGTFQQIDVKNNATVYQLNFCNSSVNTSQLTARTVDIIKNLKLDSNTLISSENMEVYANGGLLIRSSANFRGGSLQMDSNSTGLQITHHGTSDGGLFMAVGGNAQNKSLILPGDLTVNGLDVADINIAGYRLQSYGGAVNANADWITIGTN